MSPEFSRPIRVDTLGAGSRSLSIAADEAERAALARRFDLPGIEALEGGAELSLSGETVTATGRLRAKVTQSCVATGLPVQADVEEAFRILFRPQPDTKVEEEIELSEAECDVVFYAGASIDLGEAVAETLSLALDPYPRAPEADSVLREAGVRTEAEAGPFGALAGLRDKLKR